jgi:hypothetical protein
VENDVPCNGVGGFALNDMSVRRGDVINGLARALATSVLIASADVAAGYVPGIRDAVLCRHAEVGSRSICSLATLAAVGRFGKETA